LTLCGNHSLPQSAALHPGRGGTAIRAGRHRRQAPLLVLFRCTGNSARSQIAEVLLERAAGGWVDVASAGSHRIPLHPNAVRVLRSYGIDLTEPPGTDSPEHPRVRLFYTVHLGFTLRTARLPAFADVTRGNLRLLLVGPTSSAAGPCQMPMTTTNPSGRKQRLA
jgi:hypothetical protein